MKPNKYQAERIQDYINTHEKLAEENSKMRVVIVKQYTSTLFSFMLQGGAVILYEISKFGQWYEADYDIVYHITHKAEIETEQ